VFHLEDLGWGPFFQQQLNSEPNTDLVPARVAEEMKGAYRVITQAGLLLATASGRLNHDVITRDGLPAVGDWVLARPVPGEERAVIHQVLRRRTKLSRRAPGEQTAEQIIAANVDTVFLVASLNREFNIRRIERYLTVIWESGAQPVVLLNKADLREDAESLLSNVQSDAIGVPAFLTSGVNGDGIQSLREQIRAGETAVFVGSSGVGKSTLINYLLEDQTQAVREVRSDDRGRHTTTSRQMIVLPGGGVIIDTPGLRELQLWDAEAGIERAFADVESLAQQCAFKNCRHTTEPGCAVTGAIDDGTLDEARFRSYRKLEREQGYVARKQDKSLEIAEKKRWKRIHVANRQRMKLRGR